MNDVKRLPIWKHCLDVMDAGGITEGKIYSHEFFEEHLCSHRNTTQHNFNLVEIRFALEKRGLSLTARGMNGKGYRIREIKDLVHIARNAEAQAGRVIRRKICLLASADTKSLGVGEREDHEAQLRKMQLKAILMRRPVTVANAIGNSKIKQLTN